MSLGKRLKNRLTELNITQKDFALKLNISPTTLNGYFNDYREPDNTTLIKMADELSISLEYLLTGNDEYKTPVTLTPEEHAIIEKLRKLDPAKRAAIETLLE